MNEDAKDDQRQQEFAARLLEVAEKAEQVLPRDHVLLALLGSWINYAMRYNPDDQVAGLLRQAAEKLEQNARPRTVN